MGYFMRFSRCILCERAAAQNHQAVDGIPWSHMRDIRTDGNYFAGKVGSQG